MPVICSVADIPEGTARGFSVNDQALIVVHFHHRYYVYRNQCPHLGIPLEWQPDDFMDPEAEMLRCATHGALFLPDSGECVCGPCAGEHLPSMAFRQVGDQLILL